MQNTAVKGYLCALGAVIIWSGFILVSRQGGISPLLSYDVIAIRYLTCSALLLPFWLFWKRFNLLRPKFIISGLIGGLGYALFAFKGFEEAPASHAAILLPGLLPIVIALLAALLNREQHATGKWLGIAVITSGILILFGQELQQSASLSIGHLCLMGAAVCWGIFSVLITRWSITPWEATVCLAVVTCAFYLPMYLFMFPSNLSVEFMDEIALQAFYQGFLATIVQMLLYVRAVQLIGAANMGSMMAIVPILSGLSAIPVFDEPLTAALVASLICVSVGVWLANSPKFHRTLDNYKSGQRKPTCPTSISK